MNRERRVLRRYREKVDLPLFLGPQMTAMGGGTVSPSRAMNSAASSHEGGMITGADPAPSLSPISMTYWKIGRRR